MLVSQIYHLYRGAKIHNQQFYPTQFPILPLSPIFLDNGYAKFLLFIVCGFMSICTNHCHVYKSHSKPSRSIQISENLLLSPKSDQISFQPILTVNCKFIHLDFNMKYHHICCLSTFGIHQLNFLLCQRVMFSLGGHLARKRS